MRKKRCHLAEFLIFFLAIPFSFYPFIVLAEETLSFGELHSSGSVQIETSTGTWENIQPVYPLLKNTRLRTKDGVVFITTKEGSRIDVSKDSELYIEASNKSYRINLLKGTITFNVSSDIDFSVLTHETTVFITKQIGGIYSLVAGPGAPSTTNIYGMVLRNAQGTYIKSFSGKLMIKHNVRYILIDSGETFFAGLNEGTVPQNAINNAGSGSYLGPTIVLGGFSAIVGGLSFEAFRGTGHASPHSFVK